MKGNALTGLIGKDRIRVTTYRHDSTSRIVRVKEVESDGSVSVIPMDAETLVIRTQEGADLKDFPGASRIARNVFVLNLAKLGGKYVACMKALDPVGVFRHLAAETNLPIQSVEQNQYFEALPAQKAKANDCDQWNMGDVVNRGIGRDAAHTITKGDRSIIVAVLDSGIMRNHAAFASAVEKDLLLEVLNMYHPEKPPEATNSHGTGCASVILAQGTPDLLGIAPECRLLPVKIFIDSDSGLIEKAIQGFEMACAAGARIVSMSIGLLEASQALEQVIRKHPEVLVVVAAGNDSKNLVNIKKYPACYALPNMISVVASDQQGALVYNSNYGDNEAAYIAAPGVDIRTCDIDDPSDYNTMTGTSIAAPHVAGVCALAWSVAPHATVAQIKECVRSSASNTQCLDEYCFSKGLVNAAGAVLKARAIPHHNQPN